MFLLGCSKFKYSYAKTQRPGIRIGLLAAVGIVTCSQDNVNNENERVKKETRWPSRRVCDNYMMARRLDMYSMYSVESRF